MSNSSGERATKFFNKNNYTPEEISSLLSDFVADENATNPLVIPVSDPFVRHYFHNIASSRKLIAYSRNGLSGVRSQPREVVIWKGREAEYDNLRKSIAEFASSSEEKTSLPPMPAELRYTGRLLAREFNLVGLSEGLSDQRKLVLFKQKTLKEIDNSINSFLKSDQEKLEFPPMDISMRRFTATVASDLGCYARSEGVSGGQRIVVYKRAPTNGSDVGLSHTYIRGLFEQAMGRVPEKVSKFDIRAVLKDLCLPEHLAHAAIALAERESDGLVSLDTLCGVLENDERRLRALFNSFDPQHKGYINVDDIVRVFSSLEVVPGTPDHDFVTFCIENCKKKNISEMNFKDFVGLCALVDLDKIRVFGTDSMAATSLGFQRATRTAHVQESSSGLYTVMASSLSGGLSNAISRTVVAPLERTRLQMSVDSQKYRGIGDCIKDIYKKEGIRGLWAGNSLNVLRIMPQGMIAFFTKDTVRDLLPRGIRDTNLGLALASMASGIICMSAVYPLDFVRGRVTTSPGQYPNWQAAMRSIYQQGGIKGLYEGVNYSNVWSAIYYGVQFYSYDQIKAGYSSLVAQNKLPKIDSAYTGLAFGALSGSFCVTAAYPFESLRRKLQVQGLGGRPVLYSGLFDCYRKTVAKEGFLGLYKGLGANLLKTPPSIAITFGCYELFMKDVFRVQKKTM